MDFERAEPRLTRWLRAVTVGIWNVSTPDWTGEIDHHALEKGWYMFYGLLLMDMDSPKKLARVDEQYIHTRKITTIYATTCFYQLAMADTKFGIYRWHSHS